MLKRTQIDTQPLVANYRKFAATDVTRFFETQSAIYRYLCLETGLEFFVPRIAGDAKFYGSLQRLPQYYMPGKWEHRVAASVIHPGARVLELGCGEGAFLADLASREVQAIGLELNPSAVAAARSKGLDVQTIPIEQLAQDHTEQFDVVCSFQVMEHVDDVYGLIETQVKLLRPGGLLIMSVPNNDAFIRLDDKAILNLPPHHLNLWNEQSLKSIVKLFPLSWERSWIEPLQPYHYWYYFDVRIGRRNERWFGVLGKFANRVLFRAVRPAIASLAHTIHGHSIMALYKKRSS